MPFELHHVRFQYGDKIVLDDVSLTLAAGKFHGIVGPNGSGKTTVLDLLIRHKTPAAGNIFYRGKPLGQYARSRLAREMALVPQDFYTNFPYTAAEIVMMGRYPHIPRFNAPSAADREIVGDIMQRTDTARFKRRMVTALSGGERQRVIVARALAQDTPVLLLDEATSNLDIHHSLKVLALAAERVRHGERTVVAVMQDINLAALYCDDLIFMQNGRIAAQGSVQTVLTPETLREVFDVETRVYEDAFCGARQVVFRS
jgi:ABC-type cobalamin/Fe3+-siderophores transport system ATPase subunit